MFGWPRVILGYTNKGPRKNIYRDKYYDSVAILCFKQTGFTSSEIAIGFVRFCSVLCKGVLQDGESCSKFALANFMVLFSSYRKYKHVLICVNVFLDAFSNSPPANTSPPVPH